MFIVIRMLPVSGVLPLSLFASCVCVVCFEFQFQRHQRKKAFSDQMSRSVSLLRRFYNLPKIPRIPEPKHRRQQADSSETTFDPCKITQLCQNGGSCVTKRGAYYCQCPSTHYGQTCEFLADQTSCEGNLCQNDATCYSIQQKRLIVTTIGADVHKDKFDETKVTQWVQYECWCRQGFTGSLCEYPEELRHCEEDYCLHKGIARFLNSTDGTVCECECQKHHVGKRCEIILPCMEYVCLNGGICENEISNETNGEVAYKARCICPPRNIHGVAVKFEDANEDDLSTVGSEADADVVRGKLITRQNLAVTDAHGWANTASCGDGGAGPGGEHCESMFVVDEERIADDCFPCHKNAKDYLSECLDEVTQKSAVEYMAEVLKACGPTCNNAPRYCFNGGVCSAEGRLGMDNVTSYIVPVCQCVGLDEGILCEKHVSSPCDATSYDSRTSKEKCGEHGTCVGKTVRDYVCDCHNGWTGDKCDIEEPCYNNACSPGSLCVAVPIEQRENYALGYTCLCEMNQDPDFATSNKTVQCIKADFGLCANHMCKNDGRCYPCDASDMENLQLCSDAEKRRGFRCLCPHGLLPPFCEKEADACHNHKCQNGANCSVDPDNLFSYMCRCRLGFSGTFCEQQISPCIMEGLKTCIMGTCIQDTNFVRGFRCQCIDGYDGVNCDLPVSPNIVDFILRNYWWCYPLMVAFILTPIIIILTILAEDRARREYKYKLAEIRNKQGKRKKSRHSSSRNVSLSTTMQYQESTV